MKDKMNDNNYVQEWNKTRTDLKALLLYKNYDYQSR